MCGGTEGTGGTASNGEASSGSLRKTGEGTEGTSIGNGRATAAQQMFTVVQLSLKGWEFPPFAASFTLHKKKYKNQRKRPPAVARALFAEMQERGGLGVMGAPPP